MAVAAPDRQAGRVQTDVERHAIGERGGDVMAVAAAVVVRKAVVTIRRDLVGVAVDMPSANARVSGNARDWLHGMRDRPARKREQDRHAGEKGEKPMHYGQL